MCLRALIVNIKAYNKAHAAGNEIEEERLAAAIKLSIPLLRKAGMFDIFPPEDWLRGDSEGRKLVGKYAQEAGIA